MTPLAYTLGASALAVAAAYGLGRHQGSANAENACQSAALSRQLADAQQVIEQQADSLKDTQARSETAAQIAQTYQEDLTHAQTRIDQLGDQLRAGTLRLRESAATVCAGQLPGAAAGGSELASAAVLRVEAQRSALRSAAECDSTVRALQAITQSDRSKAGQVSEKP